MADTPVDAGPVGPLVILAALFREVRPFLRRVGARRLARDAWGWDRQGREGLLRLSGIGEAAAARAVQALLEETRPAALFSVGFAGALTRDVAPGDVVLGESLWRYRPAGGELREIGSPPGPAALSTLLARLRQAGIAAHAGSLVTAPVILHKGHMARMLQHLPHPVLDQETAAVAVRAAAAGVPFLGLRAVTDAWDEEIPPFLAAKLDLGVEPGPWAALAWVAARPRRAALLQRLWRRSVVAARNLGRALAVACEMLGRDAVDKGSER